MKTGSWPCFRLRVVFGPLLGRPSPPLVAASSCLVLSSPGLFLPAPLLLGGMLLLVFFLPSACLVLVALFFLTARIILAALFILTSPFVLLA
jgi:hypothetical protein